MSPSAPSSDAASRRRILILLALTIGLYFFTNFQRTAVPGALFSELQQDLGVSAKAITGFGAAFMYTLAVSQLVAGMMADQYGCTRMVAGGGSFICLGALLFPLMHSLPLLYASRILLSIGTGTLYVCLIKEVQEAFPDNFAPWLGASMFVGYAGSMAANAPFLPLVRRIGWRPALLCIAGAMLAIWLCVLTLRLTSRLPPPGRVDFSPRAFLPAMRKRHNWALYLLIAINFALFQAFQIMVGKKFLEDYCRVSGVAAGWLLTVTAALSAIAAFGMPILSHLCAERRRPFILASGGGNLLCMATALVAIIADCRAAWLFAALFFLLALVANMNPVIIALLSETNDLKYLGLCISVGNFLAYSLSALLGNGAGLLMDLFPSSVVADVRIYCRAAYAAVFALFSLVAAVSFLLSLAVRESRGKRIEVR